MQRWDTFQSLVKMQTSWNACGVFKYGHQMGEKIVIEHLLSSVEYNMFQSLIEQPPITQELLTKLTGELLARYETREVFTGGEFNSDLSHLSHQLRLYGEVLEQLSPHTLALRAFHGQLFRLMDFLTRLATRTRQYPPVALPPVAYCAGCSGLLEYRNIRQLHRELVNGQLLAVERSERSSEGSTGETRDIQDVTQEELLVRRMGSLQQNITERQVNIVRCIDDFESMRSEILLGLRMREFSREFDSFDLKAYSIQLTTHFLTSLTRVEEKISKLKRMMNTTNDQAVQAVLITDAPPQPTRTEPKLQPNRSQADFRRVNDLKIRLEDNCKRYQLELRETQSKVEVLQGQLKNFKEEIADQKFRREAMEKAASKAERDEKLREEQRAKRESMEMLMSGEQSLAGQFQSRFLQNYVSSGSRRVSEEDMLPIIKATLKRTFEGFFKQRLSLNVNMASKLHHSPMPATREGDSVERRRMSRKKTIKIQMEDGTKQMSRFAYKRNSSNLTISSQLNYKIIAKAPLLAAPVHIASSNSAYKKSVLHTEGSVKRRRDHNSNLNSILSEFKENQRGQSNERSHTKKYSQTLQTELSQQLLVPVKKVQKGRKVKLSTNHSQLLDSKMVATEMKEEKKEVLRLEGVRLMINSQAVKQFLFMSELDHDPATAPLPTHKRNQTHLSIQSLSSETILKKEKVILNLQEINYLTNFYSLLAKIHMIDAETYTKLKRWIFAKSAQKVEPEKHSLVLKQIVSEIVFKHRECKLSTASLCPHLSAFLQDLQSTLRSVQART